MWPLIARAAALAAAAVTLAACDPAYDYAVWNNTEEPVIAETHHSTLSVVRVEPGEHAQVAGLFGSDSESTFFMEIFTTDCVLLGRLDLPTGHGTVAVEIDGFTYIDRTDRMPPGPDPPFINQHEPPEARACSS
jgi:hypothetical protein